MSLAQRLEEESCGFGIGHALLMQEAAARIRELEAITAPGALVSDPYGVVDEMLEYFDSYSLATYAPLAAIIERERGR